MKMQIKQFEFYLEDDARYQFAVSWSEFIPAVAHVLVVRSFHPEKQHAAGAAVASREDLPFDIRVGVPLALKRALGQLKGLNRQAVTRAFFRAWPEAHPEFKRQNNVSLKAGDPVTQITVSRGVSAVCERSLFDAKGRDIMRHCPSCATISTGEVLKITKVETVPYVPPTKRACEIGSCVRNPDHEGPCTTNPEVAKRWDSELDFPTQRAWEDATHEHTKACSFQKPFRGYDGCPCLLAERIRRSKWYGDNANR